jgi:hypothetical protein
MSDESELPMSANVRDVLIVLLSSALIRMESDGLTVGQTADLLIKMLEREGYAIEKVAQP